VDLCGSGQGPEPASCEHCNESSGSIKGGEFLDRLCDLAFQKGLCLMELVFLTILNLERHSTNRFSRHNKDGLMHRAKTR
jgi:hypothetical protein